MSTAGTVTFERIGRHHNPPDLEVTTVTDGDEMAEQIYRYARRFLGSREVEAVIYADHTGQILVGGFRDAGSFTWASHR